MKIALLLIYLTGVCCVHFRGKARLPFLRQLFDHSSVTAPINLFIYAFSKISPRLAYIPTHEFPSLILLEQNWQVLRDEALALSQAQKIKAPDTNNDAGFNSFFKKGWKRFYLKWYEANHPSALSLCPKSVALLKQVPEIKAAMFTELPAGAKLNPHRDPYAGSLRYHLGLSTPNDDRCFINVNQQPYSWRDGQGVIFDETYIHWAYNGTDTSRLILLCDIERPMRYGFATRINRWLARVVMTAGSSPNETGDDTGGINRVFHFFWLLGNYRRALKRFSQPLYYALKYGLIAGILFWIIFA